MIDEFRINEFKEFTREEFALEFSPVQWSHNTKRRLTILEKFFKSGYPVTAKEYLRYFQKKGKIFVVRLNADENSTNPLVVFRIRNERKIYEHLFGIKKKYGSKKNKEIKDFNMILVK